MERNPVSVRIVVVMKTVSSNILMMFKNSIKSTKEYYPRRLVYNSTLSLHNRPSFGEILLLMTEQIGLKCVYTEEILVKYTTFLKEYFFVNFYKPCSIE